MSSSEFHHQSISDGDETRSMRAPGYAAFLSRWLDTPLTLPTISLLVALSADPILRAINTPLMLWNARPIVVRAWRVWRTEGRINVDFLDALAVAVSLVQGDLLAGAIVTWLIKLGDWIRDLTAGQSRRAIGELGQFQAKQAWVVRGEGVVATPASELTVGDLVVVHPGETILVDGDILEGQAIVDQKTITGESLPIARAKGATAFASTIIQQGQLTIRATRVGESTNAAQIVGLIEAAPTGDTRVQNHAEKFADRLVLPTLSASVAAALWWGDWRFVLCLLIVDFGTGVRVAAPTSVLSSMIHAAHAGIVFRSGAQMERLAAVDTVIFDKTGTLTYGAPEIVDVIRYDRRISDQRLIGLAAAVEGALQHPVAAALRAKAKALGSYVPLCQERRYKIGLGVEGLVDGRLVQVGNERFMRLNRIEIEKAASVFAALESQGCSRLCIAIDGVLAGLALYRDELRADSETIIQQLASLGIKHTVLLTGDTGAIARAVGARLGVSRVFADMLPADKVEVIKSFQRHGHVVAMVGDGVNDSPALSHADVGVSVKHGADIAREAAGVVLMEDSLSKLVNAIEISRRSVKRIRESCVIVAGMNLQALVLAILCATVSPAIIALISNGSAIVATFNGMSPILPKLYKRRRERGRVARSKPGDRL
jgi:heavy metal translocating P-type ATPase